MVRAIERELSTPNVDNNGRTTDVWIVWFVRIHVLFAVIASALGIGVWFVDDVSVGRAATVSVTLAAQAGWIWLCLFREPRFAIVRPMVFLAVALPLYVALGVAWPATMMLLFLTYWQMYSLLQLRPAIVTTTVFTVVNIWAQQGFPARFPVDTGSGFGLLFGSVIFGGLFAWFIGATIHQSTERQALIDELTRTQASLAASEREQGMLAERQRLAGDVHDTIAQEFTSILMALEAARSRIATRPDEAATYLELARETARNGLGESRRITLAMRPELLTGRSLTDALRELADTWSRTSGVPATFTIEGSPANIGRDQDIAVFRSLQECLTNIRKHAAATRVDITLTFLADLVVLDVLDDGCGFDRDHLPGGVGLETMRERARQFGGRVDVETAPGEGVALSFTLPIAKEDA